MKIPYAKLPPTNAKNADLLEYFNEHVQDPNPTSIELQGFVINECVYRDRASLLQVGAKGWLELQGNYRACGLVA